MQIYNTVEYLFYLVIFLIYFKLTESISIDLMNSTSISATSSTVTLTTTQRSVKNASNESSNDIVISNNKLKRTLLEDCNHSFTSMCIKLQFIRFLEHLMERTELHLLSGISVLKDPTAKEIKTPELMARIARSYPNNPNARLNGYIIKMVYNYLRSHYLRFKLIDDKTVDKSQSLIETGRKMSKKGGMEVLMAAGLLMKGALIAISMGGIALIAGKALITALMAFTISSLVGLKSLAASGGTKSHIYEIVTKPIHTSAQTYSVSNDEGGHVSRYGHSGNSGYGAYGKIWDVNIPKSLRENVKVN